MPLIKSGSKAAISSNIREMQAAGHPHDQAVAAALDTARRYGKKYAEGGDVDSAIDSPKDISPEPSLFRRTLTDIAGPEGVARAEKLGRAIGELKSNMYYGTRDWLQEPAKQAGLIPSDRTPEEMEEAARSWAPGTALGMISMGRMPGATPRGAVAGTGGSKAIQPPVGSPEWFSSEIKGVLKDEQPSPQLVQSLDQFATQSAPPNLTGMTFGEAEAALAKHIAENPKTYGAKAPEEWANIVKNEQEAKGGIPLSKTIADTMIADLIDKVKPKDVATYLFEFAKKSPDLAMEAKNMLPKQAKSDINKALWSLTKSKAMTAEEKEIINNLYISKAKIKPQEQIEAGGTSGVTPDEIAEYFANEEKHAVGPQWEPPIEQNTAPHPSQKPGDPILGLTNPLFEQHPSPFPMRTPIAPEKESIARQWWGDIQHAWHASPAGWEKWKGKTLLLPEEIVDFHDPYGNPIYKSPELGIHSGTVTAAHTRIGPYNPKHWSGEGDAFGNPHVIPIVMKHNRPLDLPDLGSWGPEKVSNALRRYSNIPHEEIDAAMSNKFSVTSSERQITQMRNLRKLLDNHGYDSVRYINDIEDPGSVSFITWHKKNIRNAWAQFKNKSAEDLTAAIAGGSLLYPYYRNTESSQGDEGMKKGGRTMADGGFNSSRWIPRPPLPSRPHIGMIRSAIPGRTDKIGMNVKGGSYVMPADVVSGIGQGNSMAGAAALNSLLGQGPYGSKLPRGATPRVNFGRSMAMPRPPMRVPRVAKDGGAEDGEDHVPIIAAGGEYVISPEVVRRIGGGDMKHGHQILDELVLHLRKKTIHEMRKLKPPKK